MSSFYSALLDITHVELPVTLLHHVQIFTVKPCLEMEWIIPALPDCHVASNVIEHVTSVAVLVMQMIFASFDFGATGKHRINFGLMSGKNGTKSWTWVAKVLLHFPLGCPT